jgi:hypothetical protein
MMQNGDAAFQLLLPYMPDVFNVRQLHGVNDQDTVLVNGIAGIQYEILGIVVLFPGNIEGICHGPDKGQLFGGHDLILVDKLHQPEKYDELFPLQQAPVNFFGNAPELFRIGKGLSVTGNATPEQNGMVDFQVIVKNNQIFVYQVGFQMLPEKGLYDGPGFERNTIL